MNKLSKLTLIAAAIVAGGGLNVVYAQNVVPPQPMETGGVGPAVATGVDTSRLPEKAQNFIKHIGETVVKCEKEFLSGEYDVKTASGIDIEFNSSGKVVEIEAPDRKALGTEIIKLVTSDTILKKLTELGLAQNVESISLIREGYKVEFTVSAYEEALFNNNGELLAIYFDD